MSYYIGLMTGTSLDAVDAVLVDFNNGAPNLMAAQSLRLPPYMQEALIGLFTPGADELDRMGPLHRQLGYLYSEAVIALLTHARIAPERIVAIGNHGQTIRHRPRLGANRSFSLQIGDNHHLAQSTGICVVGDFRARDIALGGQGAPLVPGFHQAIFGSGHINRSVVNIGGIANVTYLPVIGQCVGFDTGPGNGLLDAWVQLNLKAPFDTDGRWASTGAVDSRLLQHLLAHPYFCMPPPKSTGKEEFTLDWLQAVLRDHALTNTSPLTPADVQRTLLELTAMSVGHGLEQHCPLSQEVYICGGGVFNRLLMDRLKSLLPVPVFTTAQLGVEPQWVEAMAFAWLAKQCLDGKPGNVPSVTGASAAAVLGAIYPAG